MKRILAIFLSLLLLLCACGAPEEQPISQAEMVSSVSSAEPASVTEDENGYLIPSGWTETSINDGSFGYVTEEAKLEIDSSFQVAGGNLVSSQQDGETGAITLRRYQLGEDGTSLELLDSVTVDVAPQTDEYGEYVAQYAFGENCLWFIRSAYTVLNQDTGETESRFSLEQADMNGNLIRVIPLDQSFGTGFDPDEEFVTGLSLSPEEAPLLSTINRLIFCDSEGNAAAEVSGAMYRLCQDRDGRVYVYDDDHIYTVDWNASALGSTLLDKSWSDEPLPGGGPYDFLLSGGSVLKGINLGNGTVTEILSWSDCDLAESVGTVVCLDGDTFLVSAWDVLSGDGNNQLLRLTRVPADQIPEKTVIRMAAALSKEQKEFMSDTDAVDQMLMMAVNRFNRGSSEYRVELEIIAGATELGTMMAAGDVPDLIDWNNYGQYIDDPISMEALAKRGYLVDLEPLIDADSELSTDDFLPGLISAMRERTGGLHTVPTYIYSLYLSARTEYVSGYVGKDGGWTFSDLLAAARTMPEDMTLFDYMTQQDALAYFLSPCLSEFVDVSKGTCDFENQEFYDLLTMCRDYCPAETSEDFVPAESLLRGDGVMGRLGQFASDTLRADGQNSWSMMPFPNTGGSPFAFAIYDELSICAYGEHQEGAWQFLRTLLSYDYQYGSMGMLPTRIDAMNDREDWYLEVNGSCTEEESQAARQLLLDSTALRSRNMTVINMIQEETAACFAGDKSPEEVARLLQSRMSIYLGELS